MDTDALKAARKEQWSRLRELSRQRHLNGGEISELARLYRHTTVDLARVRTKNPDQDVIRELSANLAQARSRLTGTEGARWAGIAQWAVVHLPASLYSIRWVIVAVMVAFLLIAGLQATWLLTQPELFSQIGTKGQLTYYAQHDFVAYYSQDTNAQFGASVWANNAFIAAQCIGGGITGIFPVYVLYQNAVNVGIAGAIVTEYASGWQFFRFILPHGLPELTAIFVAGAAGLRIFWAFIVPGDRTRLNALAHIGRSMLNIVTGMVILLFISGLLEGFITPSSLPDVVKIAMGLVVTFGFWLYVFVVGGRAYRAGFTGDQSADAGYAVKTVG